MAPVRRDKRSGINLALRMEKGTVRNTNDIKSILASQKVNVNARNKLGWSPLMIACAKGRKSMVKLLLEHGADPNARCTKDGNTPMHYATLNYHCQCLHGGDACYYSVARERGETQIRLAILRMLISHGATPMYNTSGLNPPCMAALHDLPDIVDFFVQRNTRSWSLTDAEKATAFEILAVASGIHTYFGYFNCIPDPRVHFYRALAIREGSDVTSDKECVKSDLAASFSLFSTEECKTYADWEQLKMDRWAIQIQSFLLADKVLPEEMKTKYILPKLLIHAFNGMTCSSISQERLSQDLQIFRDALQWELESNLETGSVLSKILSGIHVGSLSDDSTLRECFELMDLCLSVFSEVPKYRLRKVNTKLLHELGHFLFDFGLSDDCKSQETFESLLRFSAKMISIFRRRCGGSIVSVTHYILEKIDEKFWPCVVHGGSDRRVMEFRVKRLISKILPCEDASQISDQGNSMLHSLLEVSLVAHRQFIRDVALILIRSGCNIEALNANGETAEDLILLVSLPTSVLPLEEIAARSILRHKIPHEGILPRHLSAMVTGELDPDSELFPQYAPIEYNSDSLNGYESEFDGSISDSSSFNPSESSSSEL